MTLNNILGWSSGLLCLVLSFIEIPKIKLSFWGLIGKAFNKSQLDKLGELDSKISTVANKLDNHIKDSEIKEMNGNRQRILRFNSELMEGKTPTEEYFNQILMDIDEYEKFCETHEHYPNNVAALSIHNIKRMYQECMKNNSFLSKKSNN